YDAFLKNRTAQLVEALNEAKHEYQEANQKVQTLEQQLSSVQTQLADSERKKQVLEQDTEQLSKQLETIKKDREEAIRKQRTADDKLQEIERKHGKPKSEPIGAKYKNSILGFEMARFGQRKSSDNNINSSERHDWHGYL